MSALGHKPTFTGGGAMSALPPITDIGEACNYRHFGRAPDNDGGFSWEKTDLADAIRRAVR
jgi:S-adenosylmethionine synthetase